MRCEPTKINILASANVGMRQRPNNNNGIPYIGSPKTFQQDTFTKSPSFCGAKETGAGSGEENDCFCKFTKIMTEGDMWDQEDAASQIGELAPENQLPAFEMTIKINDPEVKKNAIQGIGRLAPENQLRAFEIVMDKKIREIHGRDIAAQLGCLTTENRFPAFEMAIKNDIGFRAASYMGRLEVKEQLPAFKIAMKIDNPDVQIATARQIEKLEAKEQLPAFKIAMKIDNPDVQKEAGLTMKSLNRCGPCTMLTWDDEEDQ